MMELVKGMINNARHSYFLAMAEIEAGKATCLERRCGAVLVKDEKIIGRGFNSPPGNLESQRRCGLDKESLDPKVTEKTCCVHAERRALRDAERRIGDVTGSIMYFASIDKKGNVLSSGRPYCTDCSKNALDSGVEFWVLEHKKGITIYNAEEYNDLSFNYHS